MTEINISVWFYYKSRLEITRLTQLGLSLRELIHEFKYQTLVLFKCCLLQPKVTYPVVSHPRRLIFADAVFWISL